MQEKMTEQATTPVTVVGSAMAASSSLTVGYVIWTIRGGLLASSVLAHLPAWQFVDPLVVLESEKSSRVEDDEDEESLGSIIDGGPAG
jgi:hypothetical protein